MEGNMLAMRSCCSCILLVFVLVFDVGTVVVSVKNVSAFSFSWSKGSSEPFGRRKLLAKANTLVLTGILATATTTGAIPISSAYALNANTNANANKKDDEKLLSLESAARFDTEFFADRLNYPHPGLRRTASPVESFGSDLEIVADRLVKSLEAESTIESNKDDSNHADSNSNSNSNACTDLEATTAVQYGIDARIIVLRGAASPKGKDTPVVFVNPNILARSSEDKMVPLREQCLVVGTDAVWPEGESPSAATPSSTLAVNTQTYRQLLEVEVWRDESIEVAAQDITGKPIRMALSGKASRAFQHELDHLDGILIVDHATIEELPPVVAFLEEGVHASRQKRAFARATYQGNVPLYW